MACPEGNEVCNMLGLPIMVNVLMSIIAAGLGTAKKDLRIAHVINVIRDDVNIASQSFGVRKRNIKTKGKSTSASPRYEMLYSRLG
tara:strand:- start:34 stop:291 length:258 start_codon:yes stop_codon:yes gene_type:complete